MNHDSDANNTEIETKYVPRQNDVCSLLLYTCRHHMPVMCTHAMQGANDKKN